MDNQGLSLGPVRRMLYNHREMAAAMGISEELLQALVDEGLPRVHLGKQTVRYDPSVVRRWWRAGIGMDEIRRHPDIFRAEEAATYLGMKGPRSLESLRDKWGLQPLPIGQGLYHREDLDRIVQMASTGEAPIKGAAKGQGRHTRLTRDAGSSR